MPDFEEMKNEACRSPNNNACVFCNGQLKDEAHARRICSASSPIIAADGGSRHLKALGIKPDVIIGDMDSIDTDSVWFKDDVLLIKHPANKDKSDAELAVDYALEKGCDRIILLAAFGGRIDHTLCNIAIAAAHPGRVSIEDGVWRIEAVRGPGCLSLSGEPGGIVSLLSFGPESVRVTTSGLKYPLKDEPMRSATHGLSNEFVGDTARIQVHKGLLLILSESGADSNPTENSCR